MSSKAVDGNTDGAWGSRSLAATVTETDPWWSVDLQQLSSISSVEIWSRTDCCQDRIADVEIYVSSTDNTVGSVVLQHIPNLWGHVVEYVTPLQ